MNQIAPQGVIPLNEKNKPFGKELTIVIVGADKKTTNIFINLFKHMGIFCGDKYQNQQLEDLRLKHAYTGKSKESMAEVIHDYNNRHNTWACTYPGTVHDLAESGVAYREPYYLFLIDNLYGGPGQKFIFKESVKQKRLNDALDSYLSALQFISALKDTGIVISPETALRDQNHLVTYLIKNSGLGSQNIDSGFDRHEFLTDIQDYYQRRDIKPAVGFVNPKILQTGLLKGWARALYHDDPVKIEVYINSELTIVIPADSYRKDILNMHIHPTGKCGFELNLRHIHAKPSDKVVVKVKGDCINLQEDSISNTHLDDWLTNGEIDLFENHPQSDVLKQPSRPDDSQKEPYIFVHIPKTAGTSFRYGADKYFGSECICKDYGPRSAETSPQVMQLYNNNIDQAQFKKLFLNKNYRFLTGHVNAIRYISIFGINRAIVFLRNPLQRIISEYKHFVRHFDHKESFEAFYRSENFINKQFKLLERVPWCLMGMIGITEEYEASLEMLNQKYNTDIQHLQVNLGKKYVTETHRVSKEQETEIEKLNTVEIQLYNLACDQFAWRKKLYVLKKPFVKGMISSVNQKQNSITGWACYDNNDDPVNIVVSKNGEKIKSGQAVQFKPNLKALEAPRGGFIGFSFNLPELNKGDLIDVHVEGTQQPLVHSGWTTS